jgi:hypothetical protein
MTEYHHCICLSFLEQKNTVTFIIVSFGVKTFHYPSHSYDCYQVQVEPENPKLFKKTAIKCIQMVINKQKS